MASRELQLAIDLCRFSRRKRRPTVVELGGLAELRARYDDIADSHPLPDDVSYEVEDAGGVSAEWVSGPWCRDDCVILYLHGGCYATGSVETHRDLITRLSIAAATRVLGLNYRLAPAHPFPAAVEDTVAAYRWLLDRGDRAGPPRARGRLRRSRAGARGDDHPSRCGHAHPGCDRVSLAMGRPRRYRRLDGDQGGRGSNRQPRDAARVGETLSRRHDPRTPLASPLYADLHGFRRCLSRLDRRKSCLTMRRDWRSGRGPPASRPRWKCGPR